MAPFRRPGLAEDDMDGEAPRPAAIRTRALPFHNYPSSPISAHTMISAGDEESVVSSLSAMSDLESLYIESAPRKQYGHNERDQHLLCQHLPPSGKSYLLSPRREEEKEPSAYLKSFEDEDDQDDWQNIMLAVESGKTERKDRRSSNAGVQHFPPLSHKQHLNHNLKNSRPNHALPVKATSGKDSKAATKHAHTKKSKKKNVSQASTEKRPSDGKKKIKRHGQKPRSKSPVRAQKKPVRAQKKPVNALKLVEPPKTPTKKGKSRKSLFSLSCIGKKKKSPLRT